MNSDICVLYVEDDKPSQLVMQLLLQSLGIQHINTFSDSQEFETRLAALDPQPDIFLFDIHLLPLDGFELLKIIRSNSAYDQVPVVALTASVMNEEVEKLRNAGFNGAIGKPISMTQFPDQINKLLAGESIWHIGD